MTDAVFSLSRIAFVMAALTACSNNDDVQRRDYPVVDTQVAGTITAGGARLTGTILDIGEYGIADHGFVFDDETLPRLDRSESISLGPKLQKGSFSAFADRNLASGETYYVRAYAIAGNGKYVVYGQQVKFTSMGTTLPVASQLMPQSGAIGDTVAIIGTKFSNVPSNNRVYFGNAAGTIIRPRADTLWCEVPSGLEVGENEVTVYVGETSTKALQTFTLNTMTLTDVSPLSVIFGDTVVLTGTHFPLASRMVSVDIIGKSGEVVSLSRNTIKAVIPRYVAVPGGLVTITAGKQTVSSSSTVLLLPPTITSFTPASGGANTVITINGSNFSPVTINNSVTLNGKALEVTQASLTQLKAKVPAGITPGQYGLSLTVATRNIVTVSKFQVQ